MLRRAILLIVPGFFCACATTQIAPEHLQAAQSAIQDAETAGATKSPSANVYMQYAHDEIDQAKQLADSGNRDPAEMMVLRSEVDAKLAKAIVREDAARADAKDVNEKLKTFQ